MNSRKSQTHFFIGLFIPALILCLLIFLPFLSAIVIGATFAVMFYPVYVRILRVVRMKSIASALTTLLVILLVFAPFVFFGTLIFQEAQKIYEAVRGMDAQEMRELVPEEAQPLMDYIPGSENISQYIQQGARWAVQNLGSFFASAAQFVINIVLSVVVLYYLLKDGPRFIDGIISVSPFKNEYDRAIVERLRMAVSSVVKGSLLIGVLQGISTGVGFAIFGVPHAVLWGGVAAIAAMVPNTGVALVIIPGAAYLFAGGNTVFAIGLLIWGVFAVGMIDNLLAPILIQRGIRIHPVIILLSVLGGISMLGPIGFIVGPLAVSFLFAILEIYTLLRKEGVYES